MQQSETQKEREKHNAFIFRFKALYLPFLSCCSFICLLCAFFVLSECSGTFQKVNIPFLLIFTRGSELSFHFRFQVFLKVMSKYVKK